MADLGVSCTVPQWRGSVEEGILEVVAVPEQKTCVPTPPQLLTSAVIIYTKFKQLIVGVRKLTIN